MTDLEQTIQQYQAGCAAIRQRIAEIGTQIFLSTLHTPSESVEALQKRRFLLYTELAEMQSAIHAMQGYLSATRRTPD